MKKQKLNWKTKIIRIDCDTGAELTEKESTKEYTFIKQNKEIIYAGKFKNIRIVQITKLYRNKQQLEFGF